MRRQAMAVCAALLVPWAAGAAGGWDDFSEAELGANGILKKIWVKTASAQVFRDAGRKEPAGKLRQNAKAYYYGLSGDGMAFIGDRPKKEDCKKYGYIGTNDVVLWDTDEALRLTGYDNDAEVVLFSDENLTRTATVANVVGTNSPAVEPFPIFRKCPKAYEVAFVYGGGGGGKGGGGQAPLITMNLNDADVVFLMDITGSMGAELAAAKAKVADLLQEFCSRDVQLPSGQKSVMEYRFAFLGYRDRAADGDRWKELVPFVGRTGTEELKSRIAPLQANGGGDDPESVYGALEEAARLDWNKGAGKLVVLIGDAPPNDRQRHAEVIKMLNDAFIHVHAIVVGDNQDTTAAFSSIAAATGGQFERIADVENTATVAKMIKALETTVVDASKVAGIVEDWEGHKMSRGVQEFIYRGIIDPDLHGAPPAVVYIDSTPDNTKEVCVYKKRTALHGIIGDIQGEVADMIEDPNPETLAWLTAGGFELIAELEPNVIQEIMDNDAVRAGAKAKEMLAKCPALPDILKKLMDKGAMSDFKSMAKKMTSLDRFVNDDANFFEEHAWVPLSVMK